MIVGTKYDKELKEKVFYVREVDSYTHKTTTNLTVDWVDGVFTLTAVVSNLIGKGFVKFYRDGVEVGEQYVSKTATLLLQSETNTGVFVAKFMGNSDCLKSQSSEVGYSPLPIPEFSLTTDKDNGVVMLDNCSEIGDKDKLQSNRYRFTKEETIVLCCLWLLYVSRIKEGTLSSVIVIGVSDLIYELEKYDARDMVNKTALGNIFKVFKNYSLMDVDGNVGDIDCKLILYPSLQFALDTNEFERFVKEVVETHGGLVQVDSRPQTGTTFTILIPEEESDE